MIRLAYARDNADEEQMGRVTVEYLGHESGAESAWAHVATPSAGDGAGLFTMPEDGDLVAVGFINNDINQPVILGALWNGAQKAPADASTERCFVSRNGHSVTLSDGDDDGVIIADAHDNRIVMNKDGITITTAGDLNIEVAGATNFTTEGEATLVGSTIKLNP